jgi:hypothetical protein
MLGNANVSTMLRKQIQARKVCQILAVVARLTSPYKRAGHQGHGSSQARAIAFGTGRDGTGPSYLARHGTARQRQPRFTRNRWRQQSITGLTQLPGLAPFWAHRTRVKAQLLTVARKRTGRFLHRSKRSMRTSCVHRPQ